MYIVTSHSTESPNGRAYRDGMHPDAALRLAEAMLSSQVMTAYDARGIADEPSLALRQQGRLVVDAEARVIELPVSAPETE